VGHAGNELDQFVFSFTKPLPELKEPGDDAKTKAVAESHPSLVLAESTTDELIQQYIAWRSETNVSPFSGKWFVFFYSV
jgi:hypothetical protein